MKHTLWLVFLVMAALAAGCSKPKPTLNTQASTNSASAEGSDAGAPAPVHGSDLQAAAPAAPVAIPDSPDTSATLSRLSLELRRYVVRTRSAPGSFDDFLAKSQIQAPPAPAGKKYALQSGAVVLVNQ